jgi:hypothetical protein
MAYLSKAQKSHYWSQQSKFIFISTQPGTSHFPSVTSFFNTFKLFNFIIVGLSGEQLEAFSFNPFQRENEKRLYQIKWESASTIDDFFPDKLKDLKGFIYKSIYYEQFPVIFLKKTFEKKMVGVGTGFKFLETVAKHQNAHIHLRHTQFKDTQSRSKEFADAFNNRKVDLSPNTDMVVTTLGQNYIKFVNTFETDGYCVMLPYPNRKSFFSYVMKPFDVWTWMLIVASMLCLMIVWHFFNKHSPDSSNTAWYFCFAFVAFFLGQGVEFREHRPMQTVLIQLMLFLVFIFGNLYQSALISLMAEPSYEDKITTIQGMIDSNFTFKTDKVFMKMFKESENYPQIARKITEVLYQVDALNFENLSDENTGLILGCSFVDSLYLDTGDLFDQPKNAIDFYYKMPEMLFSYCKMFPTAPFSPFIERLQEYSLKIHESGMKQRWKNLFSFKDMKTVKERKSKPEDYLLLNFDDMLGAFYCVFIGSVSAILVFLVELLCYKYRVYIRRSWIGKAFKKCTWTEKVERRKKLMTRRRARVVIEPFEMIQC